MNFEFCKDNAGRSKKNALFQSFFNYARLNAMLTQMCKQNVFINLTYRSVIRSNINC